MSKERQMSSQDVDSWTPPAHAEVGVVLQAAAASSVEPAGSNQTADHQVNSMPLLAM
jgi:hypothetical protein